MSAILIVALKELQDALRNRWIISITVIFVLFAMGLAYFGTAASGQTGFSPLSTMMVSLASLAIFIIPLIALLLAYDSIIGEEELGTLLLLLTYPLGRWQLLIGKFSGQVISLGIATLLGFSLAGVLILGLAEDITASELIPAFALFIFSAIALGAVFIAIALLISCFVNEKSKAAGFSLFVWFLFVLIFDLALLGLLVATEGGVGAHFFPYLLLCNPTDIFRLLNISGFEASQVQAGLLSVASPELLSTKILVSSLLLWIITPLSIAIWLFERKNV